MARGGWLEWIGETVRNTSGSVMDNLGDYFKKGASFALGKIMDVGIDIADEFSGSTIGDLMVGTLKTLGGHIGYWVRPSARRRGIGSRAFLACLPHAYRLGIDPALVTCDEDNVASRRIIESGGGRYENVIGIKRRYWVPTHPDRIRTDHRAGPRSATE